MTYTKDGGLGCVLWVPVQQMITLDRMMKKLLLAGACAFGISTAAFAALPPHADSAWQMTTIFESEEVIGAIEGSFIVSMEYQGADEAGVLQWRLRTDSCVFVIGLKALPMSESEGGVPMVGRVDYEIAGIRRVDELCATLDALRN
ncbi:hypothetical protein [Celeribacter indicus]|nr:hypothetical protein [Celeribacter indicus]